MRNGATSRADVAVRTGLDADVVDAVIEQLTRLGALRVDDLTTTCPTDGCSGCGTPTGNGCATPSRGPVLITLSPAPAPAPDGHR